MKCTQVKPLALLLAVVTCLPVWNASRAVAGEQDDITAFSQVNAPIAVHAITPVEITDFTFVHPAQPGLNTQLLALVSPEAVSGGGTDAAELSAVPETDQHINTAATQSGGWQLAVSMYVWIPDTVEGDITARGVTSAIRADMGDLLDVMEGALTAHVELSKDQWTFILDGMYLNLAGDVTKPLSGPLGSVLSGDVETQVAIMEFAVAYELAQWALGEDGSMPLTLEVLGGGRYTYMKVDIDVDGTGPVALSLDVEQSTDWVDLIIGGRVHLELSDKLGLLVRGDVGGFDIGSSSELVWNVLGMITYKLNDKVTLLGGYRVLDYDYVRGSGSSKFEFDVQFRGPLIAMVILF